jgi:ElaB/YqjD/DUF883 family membrane-anchored ribosome-binding protein
MSIEFEPSATFEEAEHRRRHQYETILWYQKEVKSLRAEVEQLLERDRQAATHVESVLVMRTGFTGEPPYIGWIGLGIALNEALDERDRLRAEVARLTKERDQLRIAWELTQQDCHNLTEKVIPNIRAERDQIIDRCAEVCDEIEELVGSPYSERAVTAHACAAAIRAMKGAKE